jgi:hypothetical protein
MVKVKTDMTGWKMCEHGVPDSRLVVIEQAEDYVNPKGEHRARWLCECQCEQHTRLIVDGVNLRQGITKSCGCLKREVLSVRMKELRHKVNEYDLFGDYGIGWTNNTGNPFYFDLDDYDKIKDYCWFETTNGYIQANTPNGDKVDGRGFIKLHRLVTNNQWEYVDHINRNKFDNRKANLRECSRSQNGMNRDLYSNNKTGITGVYYNDDKGRYEVSVKVDCQQQYLGSFIDKEEAIRCRLQAESKYYGEFAPQRHLFKQYGIVNKL